MSEVIELSVEATNALRARLGLAPLRVASNPQLSQPAIAAPSNSSKSITKPEPEDDEEDSKEEDDDDELGLDEERLAGVEDGAVMVLDDVDVLAETSTGNKTKKTNKGGLVVPGERSRGGEDQDEDGANGGGEKRGKKRPLSKDQFIGAIARSDEPMRRGMDEDDEKAPESIAGARLFHSDLKGDEDAVGDEDKKSKKKKKSKRDQGPGPEQVKIVRRSVHRGVVLAAEDDDEGDRGSRSAPVIAPRVYGTRAPASHEDEEDELESSLARARRSNIAKTSIKDMVMASSASSMANGSNGAEFEVYMPSSDFSRIIINTQDERSADSSDEPAPNAASSSSISSAAAPAPSMDVKMEGTEEAHLGVVAKAEEEPPKPELPKQKSHRRGLAGTLSLMKETGEVKSKEEIVVGRARDARPVADLNRPEDIVKLEYRDDHGRLLTQKEAYRQIKYQMRGEGPGAKKLEKRERQLQREQAARSDAAGAAAGPALTDLLQGVKKDHLVLYKN